MFRYAVVNLRKIFCVTAVFQTVRSSGYRLAENNRLMRSSKVSGSNIVPGVHCLVHDVNIHLLTIEFSRLIIGGVVMSLNNRAIQNTGSNKLVVGSSD